MSPKPHIRVCTVQGAAYSTKTTLKLSFVLETNSKDFVCFEDCEFIFSNIERLNNKVTTLRRQFLTHADFPVSKATTFGAC